MKRLVVSKDNSKLLTAKKGVNKAYMLRIQDNTDKFFTTEDEALLYALIHMKDNEISMYEIDYHNVIITDSEFELGERYLYTINTLDELKTKLVLKNKISIDKIL